MNSPPLSCTHLIGRGYLVSHGCTNLLRTWSDVLLSIRINSTKLDHAEDKFLFIDTTFVPLLEALQSKLTKVKGYVIMTDEAHMPTTTLPNVLCYETLLAQQSREYQWPQLDERQATSICYTSGTTGNPKGVVYSKPLLVVDGGYWYAMIGIKPFQE